MKARPSDFQTGDVLQDGATVIGITFVTGGIRVDVTTTNGVRESRRLNGRYKYDINREVKS